MPGWGKNNHYDFDLICIGAGSAGLTAANLGRHQGKTVALVEADQIGGVCPHQGCIPSKALLHCSNLFNQARWGGRWGLQSQDIRLNYDKVQTYKNQVIANTQVDQGQAALDRLGITYLKGRAGFINPTTISVGGLSYRARNYIIATGSKPIMPQLPGLKPEHILTYREFVNLSKLPASVLILGAGPISLEMAWFFNNCQTQVIMVSAHNRLLPKEDKEAGQLMTRLFEQNNIQVDLNCQIEQIKSRPDNRIQVSYLQADQSRLAVVDKIVLDLGQKPNLTGLDLEAAEVKMISPSKIKVNGQLQTSQKHIYVAGDAVGHQPLTHLAIYQASLISQNLWLKGRTRLVDYRAIPRVVFSQPEVAAVGLTEANLMAQGQKYRVAISPIGVIGRANISYQRSGFVKIITKNNNQILGATIVSPRAGEMIHELALAIKHNLTSLDVAETIHAFPTYSEAIRLAALQLV